MELNTSKWFEVRRIERTVENPYSPEVINNTNFYRQTVWDILTQNSKQKRIKMAEDLIERIDEKYSSWIWMLNMPEYRIFSMLYLELENDELKFVNSKYVSEHWSIFDEFRKKFLKEKILAMLKLSNNDTSSVEKMLAEYMNLEIKVDLKFLFDWVDEDSKNKMIELMNKKYN